MLTILGRPSCSATWQKRVTPQLVSLLTPMCRTCPHDVPGFVNPEENPSQHMDRGNQVFRARNKSASCWGTACMDKHRAFADSRMSPPLTLAGDAHLARLDHSLHAAQLLLKGHGLPLVCHIVPARSKQRDVPVRPVDLRDKKTRKS